MESYTLQSMKHILLRLLHNEITQDDCRTIYTYMKLKLIKRDNETYTYFNFHIRPFIQYNCTSILLRINNLKLKLKFMNQFIGKEKNLLEDNESIKKHIILLEYDLSMNRLEMLLERLLKGVQTDDDIQLIISMKKLLSCFNNIEAKDYFTNKIQPYCKNKIHRILHNMQSNELKKKFKALFFSKNNDVLFNELTKDIQLALNKKSPIHEDYLTLYLKLISDSIDYEKYNIDEVKGLKIIWKILSEDKGNMGYELQFKAFFDQLLFKSNKDNQESLFVKVESEIQKKYNKSSEELLNKIFFSNEFNYNKSLSKTMFQISFVNKTSTNNYKSIIQNSNSTLYELLIHIIIAWHINIDLYDIIYYIGDNKQGNTLDLSKYNYFISLSKLFYIKQEVTISLDYKLQIQHQLITNESLYFTKNELKLDISNLLQVYGWKSNTSVVWLCSDVNKAFFANLERKFIHLFFGNFKTVHQNLQKIPSIYLFLHLMIGFRNKDVTKPYLRAIFYDNLITLNKRIQLLIQPKPKVVQQTTNSLSRNELDQSKKSTLQIKKTSLQTNLNSSNRKIAKQPARHKTTSTIMNNKVEKKLLMNQNDFSNMKKYFNTQIENKLNKTDDNIVNFFPKFSNNFQSMKNIGCYSRINVYNSLYCLTPIPTKPNKPNNKIVKVDEQIHNISNSFLEKIVNRKRKYPEHLKKKCNDKQNIYTTPKSLRDLWELKGKEIDLFVKSIKPKQIRDLFKDKSDSFILEIFYRIAEQEDRNYTPYFEIYFNKIFDEASKLMFSPYHSNIVHVVYKMLDYFLKYPFKDLPFITKIEFQATLNNMLSYDSIINDTQAKEYVVILSYCKGYNDNLLSNDNIQKWSEVMPIMKPKEFILSYFNNNIFFNLPNKVTDNTCAHWPFNAVLIQLLHSYQFIKYSQEKDIELLGWSLNHLIQNINHINYTNLYSEIVKLSNNSKLDYYTMIKYMLSQIKSNDISFYSGFDKTINNSQLIITEREQLKTQTNLILIGFISINDDENKGKSSNIASHCKDLCNKLHMKFEYSFADNKIVRNYSIFYGFRKKPIMFYFYCNKLHLKDHYYFNCISKNSFLENMNRDCYPIVYLDLLKQISKKDYNWGQKEIQQISNLYSKLILNKQIYLGYIKMMLRQNLNRNPKLELILQSLIETIK